MKVVLLSSDLELKSRIEDEGYFNEVSLISNINNIKNDFNVMVISDKILPYNELTLFYDKQESILIGKYVFYMLSNYNDESIIDNVTSICSSKGITVIHPRRTAIQIKDIILKSVFKGIESSRKNIITFAGADHKVGCTMTTMCIADLLSKRTNSKVLLMHLNADPSTYYINIKDSELYGIDNLKNKLTNNMLTGDEIQSASIKIRDNFYVLPGVRNIIETKYYLPEHIENLINLATDLFHIIIIDAGSLTELDFQGGMTIAALTLPYKKYLITTQQKVSFDKFDNIKTSTLNRLGINTKEFLLILNKYYDFSTTHSPNKVADSYGMLLTGFLPYLDLKGWQAEFEKTTLLDYKEKEYNNRMEAIAKVVAEQIGIGYLDIKVKNSSKFWPFNKIS